MQQVRRSAALVAAARPFATTRNNKGLDQLTDMPSSSDRIPSGKHSGPGRRALDDREKDNFQFIKKWELQMQEQWDSYEAFKGQPKPKKQFGNEMAEVIWPYAMLLENVINVHRFTKSIYVYYPQRQESTDGAFAAAVAKRFSQQYLIPITFHNSQCYVETEMLVEYGEVPWVVVHCLDGRHAVVPIKCPAPAGAGASSAGSSSAAATSSSDADAEDGASAAKKGGSSGLQKGTDAAIKFSPIDVKAAAEEILNAVVSKAEELGNAVSNVNATVTALHDRAPQSQYVRINYQWYGDTQEERSSHLVHWKWNEADVTPSTKYKDSEVRNRLNFDGRFPVASRNVDAAQNEKRRIVKAGGSNGMNGLRSGQSSRQNARHSPGGAK